MRFSLRRLVVGFSSAAVVSLLLMFPHRQKQPFTDVSAGEDVSRSFDSWQQCQRVLQLSQVRFSWEGRQQQGRHRCKKRYRSPEELEIQLRELARLRGRRARVVFLGDSRIRVLHEWLVKQLDLTPSRANATLHYAPHLFSEGLLRAAAPDVGSIPSDQLLPGCVEAHVTKPTPVTRCSLLATGDHLSSEFWWRPYPDEGFVERLDWLLAECASGRCPDVTVLDGGTWPGVIYRPALGHRAPVRVAMFAADLARLGDRLRQLSAATRLLWKTDEPFTPEASTDHKSNRTQAMLVTTAAVYQTARRIPGMALWTAGITEWLQFYHGVCHPHRRQLRDSPSAGVRHECLDPMHLGSTVRWKLLQSLLNVVLLDERAAPGEFCCS